MAPVGSVEALAAALGLDASEHRELRVNWMSRHPGPARPAKSARLAEPGQVRGGLRAVRARAEQVSLVRTAMSLQRYEATRLGAAAEAQLQHIAELDTRAARRAKALMPGLSGPVRPPAVTH